MNCPKCSDLLELIGSASPPSSQCRGCGGFWLSDADLDLEDAARGLKDRELGNTKTDLTAITTIQCPACDVKMMNMVHRAQSHIQYEACTECRGAFFDAGEISDLSHFNQKGS